MDGQALDQAWLASWSDDVNRALKPFLATFETTQGYAPDDNRITEAREGQPVSEVTTHPYLPAALTGFYQAIHEVLLPDIGNGYFVHPLDHVLNELTQQGLVSLPDSTPGVVFGSDGGGILHATSHSGTIYRSRAASRDSDFELVATDLGEFLDQLRQVVKRFVATGQPGWL